MTVTPASARAPRADATVAHPARAPRDAERTRRAILAAATDEFARHGLGGARVDRIAARAKSNKRMLYYYFGSKEKLFLAVLEQAYDNIRREEQKLSLLDHDPVTGVSELVGFTWNYFVRHPEFITLLNSENLHRARHLRRSKQILAMNSPLIETLGTLLRRGQRQGLFRNGVDPLQLYISIAALGYFFLSNIHTLSTVFGRDLSAPAHRRARLEHVLAMVLGYLSKPGRAVRPARTSGGLDTRPPRR